LRIKRIGAGFAFCASKGIIKVKKAKINIIKGGFMKTKKTVLIILILSVVLMFAASGAAPTPKLCNFYGMYVNDNEEGGVIEFVNFNIAKRTATAHFNNISLPEYGIKNCTVKNAKFKVYKKEKALLFFKGEIEGKEIKGVMNVKEKSLIFGKNKYVKKDFSQQRRLP
jgi:hypothetical protein